MHCAAETERPGPTTAVERSKTPKYPPLDVGSEVGLVEHGRTMCS